MEMSNELKTWYQRALEIQATSAANEVKNNLDLDGSKKERRQNILQAINDALSVYGDNAQMLANEMYDYIMQTQGSDAAAKFYTDIIDENLVEKKINYYTNQYEDNVSTLSKRVQDYTEYLVRRTAHDATINNCRENGTLYALVPSGLETCGFCYMLASRGFVYTKAKSKWKNGIHMHCDCITVPSSKRDALQVSGYDPDEMYAKYEEARKIANSGKPSDVVKGIEELAKKKGWDYMYNK